METEKNKKNWRPWEHRSFMQATPDLNSKDALIEYAEKESTGKVELDEMIKMGLLKEEDLV